MVYPVMIYTSLLYQILKNLFKKIQNIKLSTAADQTAYY